MGQLIQFSEAAKARHEAIGAMIIVLAEGITFFREKRELMAMGQTDDRTWCSHSSPSGRLGTPGRP